MEDQDKTREQLTEEVEKLRQRVTELEAAAKQRQEEGEHSRPLRGQALLSEAAIELMDFSLDRDGDIYQFIGERLRELGQGRFVVVSAFDPEVEQMCVQTVVGWDKHSETILEILGRNPIGMALPLEGAAKVGLFTRELERVESGLYEVAMGRIPRGVCRALEKALNLGDFYTMGFVRDGDLLGSAVLVLDRADELGSPQAVKAFMGLVAVALQRRRAEKALLKSEERLREAERVAGLGHYEIDVASGEAVWSDEAFRIFGMSPDQEALTLEALRDLIHEEDRTRAYGHFQRCVKERRAFDLVYRVVPVDGDIRYVHNLGEAEEDPETGRVKVFGTFQDITERRRAEEALRQRNRELALLHRAGQAFDSSLDLKQVLATVLEETRRLLGVVACSVWLVDPDTDELVCWQATGPRREMVRDWRLAPRVGVAGQVVRHGESFIVSDTRTDERYFASVAQEAGLDLRSVLAVPLRVKGGVIGVLEMVDVEVDRFTLDDMLLGEQLAASAAIAIENARLYEQAQQEIAERKRAEKRIERYAVDLERSNRDLEQFAYAVSHDLQEPLRVVKSYLRLLEDRYSDQLESKAEEYVDHAVDGAERMQEMIGALLDLSRVGTQGDDPAPADAEEILKRVLGSLERAIEDAGAEVTHGQLPTVMADEAQLAQVFQNLIANAIKFRKEDVPPRVHVSAEREGDEWVFSVADNGIGIDPDQAERIFEVFQRLHTEEEYSGLGIGLALCRRIVERHGGRIWVESEPGEGSTFTFTLPTRDA
jgi:PAS domain S-box-containing protein